jgi:hypothetical protein
VLIPQGILKYPVPSTLDPVITNKAKSEAFDLFVILK